MLAYTVHCAIADRAVADRWVAWLHDEHLADVCAAGALEGVLVELDTPEPTFEVRYLFADRAAFDRYEEDHAPRLREEGLALFPLSLGLVYRRTLGIVRSRASV